MRDKLRKLFAGSPPRAGLAPLAAERPPRTNPPRTETRRSHGAPGGSGGPPRTPLPNTPPETAPVEISCPNCGEPMFSGWGTTCGKCRPNLVAPKTLFLSPGDVGLPARATGGMTLGWLVVVRAADESLQGTLIELDRATVVLSRTGAPPSGAAKLVEFDDGFMSSGHALLRSPPGADRDGAFTIADRDNPSPSANGTFVSSHKLAPGEVVRLSDGDVIKVGATELLFKSLWLPPSGRAR